MDVRRTETQLDNANPMAFGDEELFKPKKKLEEYQKMFDQNTVFFSSYNPDMIEEQLLKAMKAEGVKNMVVNQNKYKIKFEKVEQKVQKISNDEQANIEDAVMMQVRITKVSDGTVAVEFTRLRGTKICFLTYYSQYKDIILNNLNDTNEDNQTNDTAQAIAQN